MESPISTNENLDQNIEDLALDSLEFKEYGEKLEIFHSVYWMSYPAIILSIWNIVLPYVVLPNSK